MLKIIAALLALSSFGFLPSVSSANEMSCKAPMDQWQKPEALQTKLEGQGWKVKQIKTEDGCYEVYALDEDGKRVETLFDPATLKAVDKKDED
ncbi:PepSY domain-containing protein [Thalassospira mesophila]|uniref:PepSY domain-containing protein n=1 Tax=Thalassospira mesophila TaxID=1293891 RepID=A0A1Y2L1Y9_9PROT|nr:PepSY domain-containing protein [Thalassospira mesophila]OSQ39508.1 hypothetical protein TMES_05630 [Thalassospira mesophila]